MNQENGTHSQDKRKATENGSEIIQMLELEDKDFSMALRTTCNGIKQNILLMNEKVEILNGERKIKMTFEMEILEIKNTIF